MPNYLRNNLSSAKIENNGEAISVHLSKDAPIVNMINHPMVKEDRYTGLVITEEKWNINFALTQWASRRNFLPDSFVITDFDEVTFTNFTMVNDAQSVENDFYYKGTATATVVGVSLLYDSFFRLNKNGGIIYGQLHISGQTNALILSGFIDVGDPEIFQAAATGQSDQFSLAGSTKVYVLKNAPPVV